MKIIIAGPRNYTDYSFVKERLDNHLQYITDIEIVSGRCSSGKHTFTTESGINVYGADGLGERYAAENNLTVKPFPANWKEHGKPAGPIRNKEMAEYADYLIAFWDLKSKGTLSMIEIAKQKGLTVKIINISNEPT